MKFFNTEKGYGFIAPDDGSKDVFLHISVLQRAGINAAPAEGVPVRFVAEVRPKKPGSTEMGLTVTRIELA